MGLIKELVKVQIRATKLVIAIKHPSINKDSREWICQCYSSGTWSKFTKF